MLSDDTIKQLLAVIEQSELALKSYSPQQPLYNVEANATIVKIKSLLLNPETTEKQLIKALKRRWERIQTSNCQYLHDFKNPANSLCISLAMALSATTDKNYLCLLMPSLEKVAASDYLTSSYMDDDIKLKDIILSDCKQRIINIPDVVDSAQEDGLLKHNSLFVQRIKALSIEEIHRLLSRHPSVEAAVTSLNARVLYKMEGDTVGAALTRLIKGLRMGGVRTQTNYASAEMNATDFNSGMDANTAIVAFAQYLETLDPETKKQLMSTGKVDRYAASGLIEKHTVATAWGRLSQPNTKRNQDVIYCVEMIANFLEEILTANPGLYDLVSYQGSALGNIAQLTEAAIQANLLMKAELATIQAHYCYGPDTHEFKMQVLEQIKDMQLPLRLEELKFMIQMYLSAPRDLILGNEIQLIFKDNYCMMDASKGLSEPELQAYFEFNPRQKNKPAAAGPNPARLFKDKRKHALKEEEAEAENSAKYQKK